MIVAGFVTWACDCMIISLHIEAIALLVCLFD